MCMSKGAHLFSKLFFFVFPRFGVAFSPWSPGLGAVRVLWDAPLSSVRGVTLEAAHEGIKLSLAAPVQFSTDHQARLDILRLEFFA